MKTNKIKKKPILVVGAGSIGERYIRILSKKGFKNIIVLRREIKEFRNIDNAKVEVLTNFEEAIKLKPFAAIVCTPTSNHLEECLKLTKNKIHVLVEKPISHNINGFDELSLELNKNKSYLQVGYMLRFHPLIQNLKEIIESKIYGNLVCTRSVWAEYLPNWHPWENYKESYAAKKELGGGKVGGDGGGVGGEGGGEGVGESPSARMVTMTSSTLTLVNRDATSARNLSTSNLVASP